jgi:hypothetical protein
MVIGTSAPITNDAARASAVLLYHCLLRGRDVKTAFEASNALVESIDGSVSTILRCRRNISPKDEILHQVPQLVAKFSDEDMKPDKQGNFLFDLGIIGCPGNTWHVVYFTDDDEVANALESGEYEDGMCTVSRSSAVQASDWSEVWEDEAYSAYGDHRLYACATTTNGEAFVVSSTICKAIELYYHIDNHTTNPADLPQNVRKALSLLRANDGAKFVQLRSKPKKNISGKR